MINFVFLAFRRVIYVVTVIANALLCVGHDEESVSGSRGQMRCESCRREGYLVHDRDVRATVDEHLDGVSAAVPGRH